MKNLTILVLLAVTLTVTVDAGRNRKHRSDVTEDDVDHDENIPDWPSPDQVLHFEVPDGILHGGSHNDDSEPEEYDPSSGRNHKKSSTHGRSHHG